MTGQTRPYRGSKGVPRIAGKPDVTAILPSIDKKCANVSGPDGRGNLRPDDAAGILLRGCDVNAKSRPGHANPGRLALTDDLLLYAQTPPCSGVRDRSVTALESD